MPRLLRINAGAGPEYVVERDGEVRKLVGDVFGDWQEGLRLPDGLEGARVLSPVLPSKIVAVGLNYRAHAAEQGKPLPPEPLIFIKPSTTVIGPADAIRIPPGVGRVDYEAEAGIVIGRRASRVREEDADSVILGVTCVNDVTARELQKKEGTLHAAKGLRHLRAGRAGHRTGAGFFQPVRPLPGQRHGPPGLEHPGFDLPRARPGRVHLGDHDAASWGYHFYRDAGRHRTADAGRFRRN